MTVRAITVLPVLAALGAALACCQQVLSIDKDVIVQPTASACGITIPTGNCETCVASQCCDQAAACAGDPACLGLETCLLACGSDYACRATCVQTNQVGNQVDVPTLDACVAANCNSACGMICGTAGSYTTSPDAAQGCQQCIEANGCADTLACTSSVECETLGHCAYACTTPDCRTACGDDAGDVDAFLTTVYGAGIACYGACQAGHDWTCVGKAPLPRALANEQDVTLTLTRVGGTPAAGVSAQACVQLDDICTSPFSTGTSDGSGVVTLGLPVPQVFGFQGQFDFSSPSFVPAVFDLSFPLSVRHAQLSISLLDTGRFAEWAADAKITPDPARGHVWLVAFDCLQLGAGNVTVIADGLESDPEVHETYFVLGTPSPTATSTDNSGFAFFFNVPTGLLTLHVVPNDTRAVASTVHAFVQAGTVTEVAAFPTASTE